MSCAAEPEQARDAEIPGSFKVPLVSLECTFIGNFRGEGPAGCVLLSLLSSDLVLSASVAGTLLLHLGEFLASLLFGTCMPPHKCL